MLYIIAGNKIGVEDTDKTFKSILFFSDNHKINKSYISYITTLQCKWNRSRNLQEAIKSGDIIVLV